MANRKSKRAEFIEKAVPYYVLAIAWFFNRSYRETAYTKRDITESLELPLSTADLFERAIKICVDDKLIAQHEDDFGPVSYSRTEGHQRAYEEMEKRYSVFARHEQQADSKIWLVEAHRKINSDWMQIQYEKDEPPPDIWQPIPVERDDPLANQAEVALEKAIDAIRSDNGYGATHPEERRHVLDHLTACARRMKEETHIAWMYLKTFALEPLAAVIKRFGKAATGLAATEARDALIKWAREKGGEIIRFFLNVLG